MMGHCLPPPPTPFARSIVLHRVAKINGVAEMARHLNGLPLAHALPAIPLPLPHARNSSQQCRVRRETLEP